MSESLEFTPRTGLSRTLHYRTYMKRIFWFSWVFAAFSLCGGIEYVISCRKEGEPVSWVLAAILCVILPALLVAFAQGYLKLFINTVVHLRPDGITEEKPWRTTEIQFSDIETVEIWDVPYLGGHFRFRTKAGKSPVFTVALERSEYILEAIHAARPGLFSMENFLSLRRKAIMIDHSWARIKDRLRFDRKRLLVLFVVLPIIGFFAMLPFLLGPAPAAEMWSWMNVLASVLIINTAVGLACWFAADISLFYWTGSVLKTHPERVRRDLIAEQRWYYYVTLAHAGIFVGILAGLAVSSLMH